MHLDVYKRPLLWITVSLLSACVFFVRPAPSKRDVFRFIPQKEVVLTGQVETFAVTKQDSRNVILRVLTVNGQPADGRVYARVRDDVPRWKDTIELHGKLQVPYGIELKGNFNWRRYLSFKYVFTEIKADKSRVIKKAAWPWRAVRYVREDILKELEMLLPPKSAGIAGGILLGERGEFPDDLYRAFQDSGAMHLLVASGGNVGFVIMLTAGICLWIGWRRRVTLLIALSAAGIYTFIAGADAPLVRAYVMAAGACAGYLLRRNSGVFQGLVLSCLVLVLYQPAIVFETGFQMSFLATLGIVLCLNNYQLPPSWPKWGKFFGTIFSATLATQLMLLPVFANVFYKVSLVGLAANMVLVPLASVLMGIGFCYYLLTWIHAGILLKPLCVWGFGLFQYLVEKSAAPDWAAVTMAAWPAGYVAAFYIVLFGLFHWQNRWFTRKWAVGCLILALAACVAGKWYQAKDKVYLLSEWNNGAAIVCLRDGTTIVFNFGIAEDKTVRALYSAGVKRADLWINGKEIKTPLPAKQTETEWKTIWAGDTLPIKQAQVRARWELHLAQDGHVWENKGYSGARQEGLSYCVLSRGREVCIGARARFIQRADGTVQENVFNGSRQIMW